MIRREIALGNCCIIEQSRTEVAGAEWRIILKINDAGRRGNKYGRIAGYSVLLAALGVLCCSGCGHNAFSSAVSRGFSRFALQFPSPYPPKLRVPVVERNHQIVAVGKYLLPQPIVLPDTVSALPMASATLSSTMPRTLMAVNIYFPEQDAKAFLTWARSCPIPVAHTGAALWVSKHGSFLERRLPPATGYKLIDQLPPVTTYNSYWRIMGDFFTEALNCSVCFGNGETSGGRSPYALPTKKDDLYLCIIFEKRTSYVWLPLHEKSHSIVAVGQYQLPKPIVIPDGITPLPLALTHFIPSAPTIPVIAIYFSPAEEAAAYRWAKSSVVADQSGDNNDQCPQYAFWTKNTSDPNGVVYSDKVVPSTPPVAWSLCNITPAGDLQCLSAFSGVKVITAKDLDSDVTAQHLFSANAADYVGGSDDYGPDSPLKGEHRHISLTVGFTDDDL